MAGEGFTTAEKVGETRGSFAILWRLILALPTLRVLAVPALCCALVGTVGYQLFIWGSSEFSACGGRGSCPVRLAPVDWRSEVSLRVLALTAAVMVSVRILGWIFFEVGGQWAALHLHRRMVAGVGRVRTTFFDEFPSGKLINRLVRDFDSLRQMAPIRIGDTINALIELLVLAVVISFAHPLAAVVVVPTLGFFIFIQRQVAPMLQRALTMRSVALGEVLHRETDVLEGARTFLLYGHGRELFARLEGALRRFIEVHLLRVQVEAWGRFWSLAASAVYGAVTLLVVSWAIGEGRLSAVMGALVITAVFRMGGTFGWLTWSSGLLFESAAHARRVFEYVDLPAEELEERRTSVSAAAEPARPGALEFSGYTMSYRPDTPVILRDLSLRIEAGTKVGLVGRTGAGKTSLLQALFRMVHVQSGDILVGGGSLFALPVEEARELFGVVPQDPYLFEGTIRTNLDRYGEHEDGALERALQAVQLGVPLTHPVHEGGRNLSAGQRQLLCLARVMLTRRPIVVMDEPTSGVDTITDAIIQRLLRSALADRTVITIAHRLQTLAHVDRIIELSDGRVVRDGTPAEIMPLLSPDEVG